MATEKEALNISLLILQPEQLKLMRPVRALDMFDGASDQFHPDGLFSTFTFGKLGDPSRKQRFAYIDIKVSVMHPIVYKALAQLRQLYVEILQGVSYASWDPIAKDFIKTDVSKGQTGYAFFLQYFDKLKFEERPSFDRQENITLVYKFRSKCMVDKIVVLPAGYRDVEFESNGRTTQDEINEFYRKFIGVSNTVLGNPLASNPELMNSTRVTLQRTFNDLYENIMARIDGKHKLLMGKVASRNIFNGTRNVFTPMEYGITYLGGMGETGFNHSYMGIYQTMVAYLPKTIHAIRTKYLPLIFTAPNQPARLVDKKSLRPVNVNLKAQDYNLWLTPDGITKLIHMFGLAGTGLDGASVQDSLHGRPLEVAGHYLGLIYKGPNMTYRFMQDIEELPETMNREDVTPITFTEFMYCSIVGALSDLPLFITRYPIEGTGSIYPSRVKIMSTVKYERRMEIKEHWKISEDEKDFAPCFPVSGSALFQALSPNQAKTDGLTADFDGDTGSGNGLYSNNAIAENEAFFDSVNAYIGTDGNFMASVENATSRLLAHNLTRGVEES